MSTRKPVTVEYIDGAGERVFGWLFDLGKGEKDQTVSPELLYGVHLSLGGGEISTVVRPSQFRSGIAEGGNDRESPSPSAESAPDLSDWLRRTFDL